MLTLEQDDSTGDIILVALLRSKPQATQSSQNDDEDACFCWAVSESRQSLLKAQNSRPQRNDNGDNDAASRQIPDLFLSLRLFTQV